MASWRQFHAKYFLCKALSADDSDSFHDDHLGESQCERTYMCFDTADKCQTFENRQANIYILYNEIQGKRGIMAETTVLGGVIAFFVRLGIYDVVLPFLLVFTIMYAVLEKSKILGTEKFGDDTITRKNLNAMTAFVVAFLVVASSKLVEIITAISAKLVVLLALLVFFLLLVGTFYGQDEEVKLEKGWRNLS